MKVGVLVELLRESAFLAVLLLVRRLHRGEVDDLLAVLAIMLRPARAAAVVVAVRGQNSVVVGVAAAPVALLNLVDSVGSSRLWVCGHWPVALVIRHAAALKAGALWQAELSECSTSGRGARRGIVDDGEENRRREEQRRENR